MDEERNHPARPAERTEATPQDSGEQSSGRRFITGFATVGLGLAAIVAVWSWQSTGSDHSAMKGTSPASQEAASISTGHPTNLPQGSHETARPDHRDHANLPSEASTGMSDKTKAGGKRGSGIAALGRDPYLPPNAWDGSRSNGLTGPTETVQLSPVNPVEGGQTQNTQPLNPGTASNVPAPQATSSTPTAPQGQTGNGQQHIPTIPGLPTQWVPTDIPLPLPNQTKPTNPANTAQPTEPGSDSGATGTTKPMPTQPGTTGTQHPEQTNEPTTAPQTTDTVAPQPPSRRGPWPIPNWGSAANNVTDTTETQ